MHHSLKPAQIQLLDHFQKEVKEELPRILDWWSTHMVDVKRGGFFGQMDFNNKINPEAAKGLVLNARLLWSFSAGARFLESEKYKKVADRAFHYLLDYFLDKEYGAVYWSLSADGQPLDTRKQIYGLGFAIYALAEYYKLSASPLALETAIEFFDWIEKYSFDPEQGGYIEAVDRQGAALEDLRLSDKDLNAPKSMNTHLHIIEGYANLYSIWKDPRLAEKIRHLLQVFFEYIIDKDTKHLIMFFNRDWQPLSADVSYGHDIEAAWLLLEAAEILGDVAWIEKYKRLALAMALSASEGLDSTDGGLWCENHLKQKHWWVQAEAMVGFINAWQISPASGSYLEYAHGCWRFIQQHLMDKTNGEWWWGLHEDQSLITTEDKAGFWKCPYHNSRACMELIRRLQERISEI